MTIHIVNNIDWERLVQIRMYLFYNVLSKMLDYNFSKIAFTLPRNRLPCTYVVFYSNSLDNEHELRLKSYLLGPDLHQYVLLFGSDVNHFVLLSGPDLHQFVLVFGADLHHFGDFFQIRPRFSSNR